MTKNDYFAVGKAIKDAFPSVVDQEAKAQLLRTLIPELRKNDAGFQSFRFILTCDAVDLLDTEKVAL